MDFSVSYDELQRFSRSLTTSPVFALLNTGLFPFRRVYSIQPDFRIGYTDAVTVDDVGFPCDLGCIDTNAPGNRYNYQ